MLMLNAPSCACLRLGCVGPVSRRPCCKGEDALGYQGLPCSPARVLQRAGGLRKWARVSTPLLVCLCPSPCPRFLPSAHFGFSTKLNRNRKRGEAYETHTAPHAAGRGFALRFCGRGAQQVPCVVTRTLGASPGQVRWGAMGAAAAAEMTEIAPKLPNSPGCGQPLCSLRASFALLSCCSLPFFSFSPVQFR